MENYTTGTGKKEAQISCFVTAAEYEEVKKKAAAEERSISNFARQKIFKKEEVKL